MSNDPKTLLDEIERFGLSHAVAVDSELHILIETLYRSGVINRETVEQIAAAYRKSMDQKETDILTASVRRTHDDFYARLLAEDKV
ncbi:hypothetical protein [Altericroceibacterium xinjiangense]|uniref:hypothetical protein n=1 Tax=Altericroceibacterium xinjiangense TaxID=762261 RepID=UPI000F7FA896|nr:hypothetical protein [Altericroceibacterium xinjiangense]